MPEGFRIASAYVDVRLDDNTEADEKRIRARLEKGGPITIRTILDDPEGVEVAKEKVRKGKPASMPVEAENPVNAAWRAKVQASLKDTAKQALKVPLTPEGEKFRSELAAVIAETEKALEADIPVDVKDAAKFKSEVELLARVAGEETKVRIPVEADASAIERSVSGSAERATGRMKALLFTALSVGLPASAAIGAAGIAASMAAVPALFTGIAAVALKGNTQVVDSFSSLKTNVVRDTQAMAQVMAGPLAGAADDLQSSFNRMRPQILAAFTGTAPLVEDLTGSVTDFAESAMPGMVSAVQNGGKALEGFRSFAGQTGAGVSDMLRNMAQDSQAAGRSMEIFGGTIRNFLGFTGDFIGNLSQAHGPLQSFHGGLDAAEDALLKLTAAGSPAIGFLSGFTSAGAGALSSVNALASVLRLIPSDVTQMAGSFTASSMILSRFGIDAGKGFEGLGQRVRDAGKDLDGAARYGSKFGTAIGGLVGGALNPAFLAVTALGIGLDILGEKQKKAAEYAAAHKEGVRILTDALRKDNGVVGENSRAVDAKALADKNAASNLATFGVGIGSATLAIRGNTVEYDRLKTSAESTLAAIAKSAGVNEENKRALVGLAGASLETGQNYDQLKDKVKLYGTALDGTNGTVQKFTDAQRSHIESVLNGTGAVGEQIRQARAAHDAYIAEEMALTTLTAAQIEARDATTKHTEALFAAQDAALKYRGSLLTTKEAEEAYNKVSKDSKASAKDKEKALLDLERAWAAQEQAAYNAGVTASKAFSPEGKAADGMKAARAEVVKLAAAYKGDLPESIRNTIASFTPLEATAAGATIQINKAGEAIYKLPDGKEVKVKTDTEAAKQAIEAFISDQSAKTITNKLFTNTGPADGEVRDWANTTRNVRGDTTTYTHTDPATGAVNQWRVKTDSTGARTTTFSNVDPATGAVRVWKQNADGTWAETHARADVAAAERALNNAARDRTATIHVNQQFNSGTGKGASTFGLASGGTSGDGRKMRLPGYATGSLVDGTGGGKLAGPGTPTSDSILTLFSNGLGLTSDKEFVTNAEQTDRWEPLLWAINNGEGIFGRSPSELTARPVHAPSAPMTAAVVKRPVATAPGNGEVLSALRQISTKLDGLNEIARKSAGMTANITVQSNNPATTARQAVDDLAWEFRK
ncbi:hypothetical protein CFP71_01385 [Amycolatopsis thailandensis]|uniref:Uncharacterized protein n=1 Tax=Amycolatopsis thailandensis TaxID=589330 RepID=A0A229SII7_9PSEU|nr:hypothetical protein [Amycolatopsis thailandensis]OXM58695.1 hypothetical protein CFP71_01385 [Amycolatopsis thailandensis]